MFFTKIRKIYTKDSTIGTTRPESMGYYYDEIPNWVTLFRDPLQKKVSFDIADWTSKVPLSRLD